MHAHIDGYPNPICLHKFMYEHVSYGVSDLSFIVIKANLDRMEFELLVINFQIVQLVIHEWKESRLNDTAKVREYAVQMNMEICCSREVEEICEIKRRRRIGVLR